MRLRRINDGRSSSLTDDQKSLRSSSARFSRTARMASRGARARRAGRCSTATLWQKLADAGITGIAVPEEQGGGGLGFLELSARLRGDRPHGRTGPGSRHPRRPRSFSAHTRSRADLLAGVADGRPSSRRRSRARCRQPRRRRADVLDRRDALRAVRRRSRRRRRTSAVRRGTGRRSRPPRHQRRAPSRNCRRPTASRRPCWPSTTYGSGRRCRRGRGRPARATCVCTPRRRSARSLPASARRRST